MTTIQRIRALGAALASLAAAVPATRLLAQPVPPGELTRRPLERDTVLQGIPCARSGKPPAEFHRRSGHLSGCALSRDFEEAGHRFPAGTWLDRNDDGRLWGAWLARDTPLSGHTCHGEGYKTWSTRFYPSGQLASCYLARDTVIAGAPCMAGSFWREVRGGSKSTLYLYANGQFKRCQASRAVVWRGKALRKWDVLAADSSASDSKS